MTYETGMRGEMHLTETFDVGSWKVKVLYVQFCVATCLVDGRFCVTGLLV
jgi:hypothetical protein